MKVLVVDDHAPLRLILRHLLDGHEVAEAKSGEECLESMDSVDVVLLDINMPGMGGLATLRELRTRHPAIPVWMLSSSDDAHDITLAKERGASGYIVKQADAHRMQGMVRSAIEAEESAWKLLA